MKKVASIEARMTSSRFPGKVLMKSCGKPLLEHMIERIRHSRLLDDIVVATTVNSEDDPIIELCDKIGCKYYRGSEDNVLMRVLEAAESQGTDLIIELTGDCPCIDWRHIDYLLSVYLENDYDFVANNTEQTFPDGFDVRIFSTDALRRVASQSDDSRDCEHVSIYFPRHSEQFRCFNWTAGEHENRPEYEVTLDEKGDYELIDKVFRELYPTNPDFSCEDVIKFLDAHRELLAYIKDIKRTQI